MRGFIWCFAGFIWLATSGAGLAWLWSYSATPGEIVPVSADWPAASRLERSRGKFTLVMFVHPECPCSRASLGELEKLLARCPESIGSQVVFFEPAEKQEEWSDTASQRQALELPGVQAVHDLDGTEARLFSARTSGDTFVFDTAGRLAFHGGITSARGHSGDNDGCFAIEAIVEGSLSPRGVSDQASTPVYGCPLP
jgi:hypothetical protein